MSNKQSQQLPLQDIYASLVNDMPGMFCRFQPRGIIEFVNNAYANALGCKPEELIGQAFLSFIPEENREQVLAQLNTLTPKSPATTHEYPVINSGGEIRWHRWTTRLQTDENGRTIAYQSSGLDITNRHKAEDLLRQSETQLQHIIDSVPEGIILLGPDGTILRTNPIAETYLPALAPNWETGPLNQLGNRPLQEFLKPPPEGRWHEITIDEATYEVIAKPVKNSAINAGWVIVIYDVSEQRKTQQPIKQQERLAAVGQLASGIAHDFNNVLSVIVLYVEDILQTIELPPHIQQNLRTINQQAMRAANLIQSILDFSRQSILEQKILDLLVLMKDLVKLLNHTVPEHIKVALRYGDGDYLIQADPAQIQQIMMNLAVNARDAMPEGGLLQISLSRQETAAPMKMLIQDMPPGDWIKVTIADTGTGIHPNAINHIFEPFFTTKELGQGTGLGLAQVYGIMQQHEGYIDVASTSGKGTTFTLYFPRFVSKAQTANLPDDSSLHKGHGQTILVVEDHAFSRQALVDSLTVLEYKVIEAVDGRQALSILEEISDEVSLVLSDVVMPEMGGVALFTTMRQQNLNIPVILLTGHPLSQELESPPPLGLAGWLLKPPKLSKLSHMVAQALADS